MASPLKYKSEKTKTPRELRKLIEKRYQWSRYGCCEIQTITRHGITADEILHRSLNESDYGWRKPLAGGDSEFNYPMTKECREILDWVAIH